MIFSNVIIIPDPQCGLGDSRMFGWEPSLDEQSRMDQIWTILEERRESEDWCAARLGFISALLAIMAHLYVSHDLC